MSKPEDIPQDVWDKSIALMQGIPADFSWDGFEDAKSNHACAAEEVARAIMDAKAEEREACAAVADEYVWDDHALSQATPIGKAVHHQSVEISEAIRKRGEG